MTSTRTAGTAIVVTAALAGVLMLVPGTQPNTPLPHVAAWPGVVAAAPAVAPPSREQPPPAKSNSVAKLAALPLRFESNVGQTDERALFIARGMHSALFLTASEAVLSLPADQDGRQSAVRMSFAGSSTSPAVIGEQELPGRTHYLKGAESEWKRDVASYARVRYQEMYPGVDIVFYGRERELEFDVVVAPGADPSLVTIDITGAEQSRVDDAGDLVLGVSGGEVRMKRPVAYQEVHGERRSVESGFVLSGDSVGFRVGAYDASEPLVIDPVLLYATYLGGDWDDAIYGVGLDAAGNIYVAGTTSSMFFPRVAAFDDRFNSPGSGLFDNFDPRPNDAFVAKLTPSGSALIYSTYLGGGLQDQAHDLAVDSAGHAYVTGESRSPDFPRTVGAFDSTPNGSNDVFLAKLSPDGSALLYSTLIGSTGPDYGHDVAADDSGNAYVLGHVEGGGLPLTPDAYLQTSFGGFFLARFNTLAAGEASLEYSTYTGIAGERMDVAPDGDVLIIGNFLSLGAVNGFQTDRVPDDRDFLGRPSSDAAFMRVNTRASDPSQAVVYASYIGGGLSDHSRDVSAGPNGLVCLVGASEGGRFPVRNAFQSTAAGFTDAFVAVFDTSLQGDASLIYSTLIGGAGSIQAGSDTATHCRFDVAGILHVVGETFSSDFPLRAPFQATYEHGELFVARFDARLTGTASLLSSSFYGGNGQDQAYAVALDGTGGVWVGGVTRSTNLAMQDAIYPVRPSLREDAFLARFGDPDGGGGGGGEPEFLVSAIAPARGGAGLVTAVVHGTAFEGGASVQLRRGATVIAAASVKYISDAALQAVFDLAGSANGAWDVVVTNPGGQTAVLADGFQVEPRTATISASVSVVMNPIERAGRPTHGFITYSNPTNVDVILPIFIYFPRGTTLNFGIPIRHGQTVPGVPQLDFSQIPQVFDTGTEQVMPLIVNVPPGHTGVIPFTIPEGCDPANLRPIRAATGTPRPTGETMGCALALASLVFGVLPLGDCIGSIASLMINTVGQFTGAPASLSSWIADLLWASIDCFIAVNPGATVFAAVINITQVLMSLDDGAQVLWECGSPIRGSSPGSVATDRSCVFSSDPNAKYGPVGAGEARYVSGADPMTYAIAFENLPTATAAAQDVVVTDTLDAARFDLDTFVLGPISFGSRIVTPPAGLSSYITTVDLRPGVNLLLRIDARLDRTTNVATWRFTSLDPATGQPTTDPIAGFLPPNINSPEGEGTVMFTASPVATLGTDDVIRNSASIVFDVNAPIDTGEWANAIDKMTPTSAVSPLASPQWSSSFEVDWSGTDAGSGVADYTVFVSVNGGPFTAWLSNTTATSAIYDGAFGNTYAFFSLARDRVGHTEGAKSVAEVTVEVLLDTQPPVLTLPGPMAVDATGPSGAVVTFVATAVDVVDGVRPVTCTPQSGATFALGVTTVTCATADARGNSSTGSFSVTVTDPPTPGKMVGSGRIDGAGGSAHRFSFEIRELDTGADSGLFQIEGPHGVFAAEAIAFARFSDDPATAAGPGWESALPDTVVFTGPGWWNGASGYSFQVLATDRGEPGAGRDTVNIIVKAPGGATVAAVSGLIRSGNLQAKPWQ